MGWGMCAFPLSRKRCPERYFILHLINYYLGFTHSKFYVFLIFKKAFNLCYILIITTSCVIYFLALYLAFE
uniref:Uncharacterized protein n=1 Tax=Anguilla anguilla TaxID=7936 RepID=A0A0E9VI17_ANGAN